MNPILTRYRELLALTKLHLLREYQGQNKIDIHPQRMGGFSRKTSLSSMPQAHPQPKPMSLASST